MSDEERRRKNARDERLLIVSDEKFPSRCLFAPVRVDHAFRSKDVDLRLSSGRYVRTDEDAVGREWERIACIVTADATIAKTAVSRRATVFETAGGGKTVQAVRRVQCEEYYRQLL